MSRFSTTVRAHNRLYEYPELKITINVAYGTNNVEIATISLPLNTLCAPPTSRTLKAGQLQTLFTHAGLTSDPQFDALAEDVMFRNEHSSVSFKRREDSLYMPLIYLHTSDLQNHFFIIKTHVASRATTRVTGMVRQRMIL